MSKFSCIISKDVYGISGDETAPPIICGYEVVIISNDGEFEQEFKDRVDLYMLEKSKQARLMPRKPYSLNDEYGWKFTKVIDNLEEIV
jgi:hypothetical protein